MTTTTQSMTADQFFEWNQLPEYHGKHFELERGEVVEASRPGELHGSVCINIAYVLAGFIRRRRKGHALCNDTGVIWERDPDTVRGPDVFFYDEKPRFRDLNPHYSDEVPLLVVEVVSPSDKPGRLIRRVTDFLRWGVKLVWIVYPEDGFVTVYQPDRAPEVVERTGELTGGDALPDFRCRVEEFFYAAGDDQGDSAPPT